MAYTPTTWTTGDTITATKLNKMEQGIANAGSAMIVGTNDAYAEATASGTMDKTFSDIYNALKSGTPVYVKIGYETSGPSTDYACGMGMLSVLSAIKYDTSYRVYVADKSLGRVTGGDYYVGAPCIKTFTASSPSDYPTYSNAVVPSQVTDLEA